MVKAILRTGSIGAKVTEEEYARLDELAAACGPKQSRVGADGPARPAGAEGRKGDEETVLAELLGLRAILLNLPFKMAKGEPVTEEQMQSLIAAADAGKLERARKLLV